MKEDFIFYTLCADDETYNLLKALDWKGIHPVHEEQLDKEIISLKTTRKLHEYCWTLKPVIIEKVLMENPEVTRVTYMDSDLYYYRSPNPIFKNQQDCSVLLIVEEKKRTENSRNTGKYNSGFLSFKHNEQGLACVRWWKERCIESCTIDFDANVFGDQLYLEQMPQLFTGVCDVATKGVNIGPWNYLKYRYRVIKGKSYVGKHPLIFFHFSGFRIQAKNQVKLIHGFDRNRPAIFKEYIQVINCIIEDVEKVDPNFNGFAGSEDIKLFWEI